MAWLCLARLASDWFDLASLGLARFGWASVKEASNAVTFRNGLTDQGTSNCALRNSTSLGHFVWLALLIYAVNHDHEEKLTAAPKTSSNACISCQARWLHQSVCHPSASPTSVNLIEVLLSTRSREFKSRRKSVGLSEPAVLDKVSSIESSDVVKSRNG